MTGQSKVLVLIFIFCDGASFVAPPEPNTITGWMKLYLCASI